ncbi:MAG: hypothetical protein F4X65_05755 [Chloroflexi bacterium]|nr:hypothetical protein [Chloroflexota bacterium]
MEREELRPILRQKFPPHRTYLLPALHFLQEELGCLPEWALQTLSWHLRTPASVVYGAATSYTELRIEAPSGRLVRVCTGLSCWHGGGRELLSDLSETLDVVAANARQDNDSTQDMAQDVAQNVAQNVVQNVALEETACAYRCPLAPLVEVDGVWLGRAALPQVLDRLKEPAKG